MNVERQAGSRRRKHLPSLDTFKILRDQCYCLVFMLHRVLFSEVSVLFGATDTVGIRFDAQVQKVQNLPSPSLGKMLKIA